MRLFPVFMILMYAFGLNVWAQNLYHAEDFTKEGLFTSGIEGPAVDQEGNLFAVNFGESGSIGLVAPEGEARLHLKLPEGSTGNGLRFDQQGNLYVADYTGHNVLVIHPDKQVEVFAHCTGCHQPNDLAISPQGIIFLSDPDWANESGQIWRVTKEGTLSLLEANMGTSNGIEVSPDGKRLYVNESVQRNIWVYDLSPEGDVHNKRLFASFPDFGFDGMRCDQEGNLYVSRYGKGSIVKINPQGKLLLEVYLKGKKPSNLAFGGQDGKTVFVTLQDRGCFETFRVESPGRAWRMWQTAKDKK